MRVGAAEAVALALEGAYRACGMPFAAEGRHDRLRLGGRDDPVVEALEDEHRAREPVHEVVRRALAVAARPSSGYGPTSRSL